MQVVEVMSRWGIDWLAGESACLAEGCCCGKKEVEGARAFHLSRLGPSFDKQAYKRKERPFSHARNVEVMED
jgi:hypothetical protein